MLDQLVCNSKKSLFEAIKVINTNAKGVVFIVDDSNLFRGVLTDGDIRRLILNEVDLSARIEDHVSSDCVKAFVGDSFDEMLGKINERISILPVLNSSNELVDFFQYKKNVYLPVAAPDLKGNEFKYLVDAFLSTWISSSGSYITKFEEDFASFSGAKHGVAVSNGTVALHLAMEVLGVGEGDEVIVPDLTFAATINTVLHAGATPVIVDVDESWCIDPNEIKKAITEKTKAIIPVHLYGQPCDMDAIMSIAEEKNLFVIEDCAEAHGAKYKGKTVGSFGDINCFSFFGNKVITTGEGGMCLTDSDELNEKLRVYRDHGMSKTRKYFHEVVGYNYRMTNLQAAIGVGQLERIEEIIEFRKGVEASYKELLNEVDFLEFERSDFEHRDRITWLVSALVEGKDRDQLLNSLKEQGIDARPFFVSLSEMDIYKEYRFSCAKSQELSVKGINFPTATSLSDKLKSQIRKAFELA